MEPRQRRPGSPDADDPAVTERDNVYQFPGTPRDGGPERAAAGGPGADEQAPDRDAAQIPDATLDWNSAEKQGEPGQEPPGRKPGEEPEPERPSGF